MKLCLVYNFAQHYRAGIFKRMSETYDCDFFFGDSMSDIRKMDYSLLKGKVKETHTKKLLGGWVWQSGVVPLLFKNYSHYILLADTRSASMWVFCLLSRLFFRKKKVFFWTHGWYGKESRAESFIKKFYFRLPNGGIFLYGNYARNLMIKEEFDAQKLFTIHNSLDYEKQIEVRKKLSKTDIYDSHFSNSGFNLVFIGRLTPVKKLDMVIEAMRKCVDLGVSVNCTFVGGGTEAENLRSLVHEMQMEDRIWFYGPCYDEEKNGELIYNADICVSPGNVGLTAMHSLVFGTPVITHNKFPLQMPEFEAIVEGQTGAFFEYDNVDSLAATIQKWIREEGNDRERIRENCFKEIDNNWTPEFQMTVLDKHLSN